MFKGPLAQMPIALSFFLAIRKMADLPVESLKTGGLLWFPDLTAMDPYWFGLPAVSAATMLAVIELNADGMPKTEQSNMMRVYMRAIIGFTFLASSYFPTVCTKAILP
jgi:YidC/Oxa1 family membrane protein insertase